MCARLSDSEVEKFEIYDINFFCAYCILKTSRDNTNKEEKQNIGLSEYQLQPKYWTKY